MKIYLNKELKCKINFNSEHNNALFRFFSLILFLNILFTFPVSANLWVLQDTKITIKHTNVSLSRIISDVEQKSGYSIIVRLNDVDVKEKYSINETNQSLNQVLTTLFKGKDIDFEVKDNTISVFKSVKNATNAVMQTKRQITGTVTDEQGEPIIGANVVEKGTTNGIITDIDGKFSISVSSNSILEISYIGYIEQEIKVGNQRQLQIVLDENIQALDEVVVVGYGTMRKRDLTGAVAQVRPDKLANESPSTVQDLLRSGIPGLNVGITNSAKGGGSLQIRGQRSLSADNNPLIVVDNMIFFGELSEINPQDIEQIDVLKDASSSAIYGAKSANGVVIITTKKGKTDKPIVHFDAGLGFVTMGANKEVYDADGYLQFRADWYDSNSGFQNPGVFNRPTPENLSRYGLTIEEWRAYTSTTGSDDEIWLNRLGLFEQEKENFFKGKTYDWYDASFQTGLMQDYNASLSGRGNKINYYMSLGYLDSKGLIPGDDYKAIQSNLKLDATVNKYLDIGANINFQNRTDGNLALDWGRQISANSPYALPYDDDGNLLLKPMGTNSLNEGWNYAYERPFRDLDRGYTILNSILSAKVKLPFDIKYTLNFAPRFQWYRDRYHASSQHPQWKTEHNGAVNREQTQVYDWVLNNVINWERIFADVHNVNITLSQEAEEHKSWKERIEARDFTPTDALGYHYANGADKLKSSFSSEDTHSTGDALLARAFYSFDDRYMTTLSIRRDGYSAFGVSQPHATFTSAALAWTFTNENFFKWKPMSFGKLRMSWGSNGNRGIGIYTALSNLTTGSGSYGYLESNGALKEISMLYVSRMANPNLQWERTSSWNFGLDFGFLNQRINGGLDYYYMPTTDLIMNQSLPSITGFGSITTNLGEVINKGFELSLNTVNVKKPNLEWNSSFGFSLNRNKIKHLYYTYTDITDENGNVIGRKETDDRANKWFIGKDIQEIWNYKLLGMWQSGEEEAAAIYGLVPGDPKIQDTYDVESRVYSDDDKEFLGSRSPKFRWSLRNELTFLKNLSVSMNIYSYWGHKAEVTDYLNTGYSFERQNTYVRKYWTPDNPTNKFARLGATAKAAGVPKIVDRSFIRLESISFAYNFPQQLISKFDISALKVYGSIRNVAVWSKEWYDWDPEVSGPMPKTFTVGVGLTF